VSRKGGGFVLYNRTRPIGRFTFTMKPPRGGGVLGFGGDKRIRWVVGYTDPRNYLLLQMDQRYFRRSEVIDGKEQPEQRVPHNVPQSAQFIHVSIELKPGNQLEHQVSEDEQLWRVVDTWTRPTPRSLANGKFGFYLPGDDEVAISNFLFYPEP
jgi:hypothetical protein